MSSQGFGALFQGINQGLDRGLELAAKRRAEAMDQEKLNLAKEQAIIERAKSGISGVDAQGNIILGSNAYLDAISDRKRKDSAVLVPQSLNPQGQGPTAPGSRGGLGSLAPTGKNPGLDALTQFAGQYIDPEIVKATAPAKQDDWMSKLLATQSFVDRRFDKAKAQQDAQNEELQSQTQRQQLYNQAEKGQIEPLAKGYNRLDAVTGLLTSDKPKLELLPSAASFWLENLPLLGSLATIPVSAFRNKEEQEAASALQAVLNPTIRANAGLTQTPPETLRSALEKARTGDPSVLAKIMQDDYKAFQQKRNNLNQFYPKARVPVPGDEQMMELEGRRPKPQGGNQTMQINISPNDAAAELARRAAAKGQG
tara:strand:- start:1072 stop:2175 length:1104 start_codon:yes stop_codon:yes gene_type:complete